MRDYTADFPHTWNEPSRTQLLTLLLTLCGITGQKTHQGGLWLSGSVHEEAHPCFPYFASTPFERIDAQSINQSIRALMQVDKPQRDRMNEYITVPCWKLCNNLDLNMHTEAPTARWSSCWNNLRRRPDAVCSYTARHDNVSRALDSQLNLPQGAALLSANPVLISQSESPFLHLSRGEWANYLSR